MHLSCVRAIRSHTNYVGAVYGKGIIVGDYSNRSRNDRVYLSGTKPRS